MIPTKEMLAASYELLRLTPPFTRWRLPEASAIKFTVTRHKDRSADWTFDGKHEIRVSAHRNTQLTTIQRCIGHEMAHMRQHAMNPRERDHGAEFQKACRAICKHHAYWDYAEFIL